jgi:hypothetical protein
MEGWSFSIRSQITCLSAIRRRRQIFYLASRSLTRRYDLVHVHNMPDVLVFGATVPKLLGARVILDLHLSYTWSRERLTLLNSIGELF